MPEFQSGALWQRVVDASRIALQRGDLQPIPTAFEFVEDANVRFLVRIVENLAHKPRNTGSETNSRDAHRNPFLPYDPALYVADAGPDHVCLLNKFNVVDHHLLVVTRQFEHQENPLSFADFNAWWRCLNEYDSLGFYNGGTLAGASQPHKHMQLVPLPLADAGPRIPVEPLVETSGRTPRLNPCSALPFLHAAVRLDVSSFDSHERAAEHAHRHYMNMLALTGISEILGPEGRLETAYNLLLTRQWMLLVPRSKEHVATISLNAMAYAGALLARSREELDTLRQLGPMAALSLAAMTQGTSPRASRSGSFET